MNETSTYNFQCFVLSAIAIEAALAELNLPATHPFLIVIGTGMHGLMHRIRNEYRFLNFAIVLDMERKPNDCTWDIGIIEVSSLRFFRCTGQ